MTLRLTFLTTVVHFFSNWNKLNSWLAKQGKNKGLVVSKDSKDSFEGKILHCFLQLKKEGFPGM